MKPEISDKHELILDAAIRRFSHFGIQKTNMTEIADDVAMSKQSLSYYFPDKLFLVVAVVKQIVDSYLNDLEQKCKEATTLEEALLMYSEIKKTFFERYYMLYVQNYDADLKLGLNDIRRLFQDHVDGTDNRVGAIYRRGAVSHDFDPFHESCWERIDVTDVGLRTFGNAQPVKQRERGGYADAP